MKISVRSPMFWMVVAVVALLALSVLADAQFNQRNAVLAANCRASGISAYQCAQDSAHRRDMKSLTDAAAIAAGGIAAGAASPTRP